MLPHSSTIDSVPPDADVRTAIISDFDSFTVERGAPAYVIHHPDGRPKEVSLDDTEVVAIFSTMIHYGPDTLGVAT